MASEKLKVIVVGSDHLIEGMFTQRGWAVVSQDHVNPHLVVFTGGHDVSPFLYGEKRLECSNVSEPRDEREGNIFNTYAKYPKVGICRGGQFLNVKSGGKMWQDVDNHGRHHEMLDLLTQQVIVATSTHHQMMIPGPSGEEIAVAFEAKNFTSALKRTIPDHDTEVVWYKDTSSLCFQPHPEYRTGTKDLENYFFGLIEYFWGYDSQEKVAA